MLHESASFTRMMTAYHPAKDWPQHVRTELGDDFQTFGPLFVKEGPAVPSVWSRNIWLSPHIIHFNSIREAVQALREMQRNWVALHWKFHRRTALIEAGLPYVSAKPKTFPFEAPTSALGSFMLLDEHSMIASPECSSPYPNGNLLFDENHVDPPSTAYLKLWEALSRTHARPGPASVCLDAGSSPGGWTWVLQSLGARVVSVDRSELDDRLMKNPLVEFHAGNAFLCTPKTIETYGVGRLDWLVCDLAAYPRRLLAWLREWLESGLADNYVVTLKMQGEPDWDAIREFASIPGSTTYHGSFNKHELTWILENANGEQSLGTQSLA